MDEKISLEAIALYGDAYTKKVLNGYFSSKDKIGGSEILSLCNVQQVNLFVISELFKSWKGETTKLKSPYFAYEHPDVKEAMEQLMSVLSKNISIDRQHFEPLLKKAVSQALLLVFDPYDFFAMIIAGQNNKLELAAFKEEIRYLKVNKAPLEKMLQKLEEKGIHEISGNEAFSILDQILEEVSFNPEDVEDYLEKFSSVVPLDANSFYVAKPAPPAPVKPAVSEPIVPPIVPREKIQASVKEVSKPPATAPLKVQTSATINDTLTQPGRPSIVDNFQKIAKIKDSLTINQKFMFTKVLFHGDFELFSKAIDHLDKMDNLKSAMRYIENEYSSAWDNESEEFHEFMELIEKRFG